MQRSYAQLELRRGRVERDREQHVLDRDARVARAVGMARAKAGELDALVSCVLIDQHQLAVALAHQVGQVELPR